MEMDTSPRLIENLTPHDINIVVDGVEKTIAATGTVARVAMAASEQPSVFTDRGLIPVVYNEIGKIVGLPEPRANTIFIVSVVVLTATDRKDVFCPDTGPTCIRDKKGQIVAVTQLLSARKFVGRCEACGLKDKLAHGEGLCFSCAEEYR